VSITLTQLRAFLAVVRGGSVTAAAEELVVTQPSVSSAIAALGRELGCELFERHGRGVRLSSAGVAFAPYATDVIGLLEQGRQVAREAASAASRQLRIAAVTTAAESFVPPLLRAFAQERPEVELSLVVANRDEVLDAVLAHRVDAAIAGHPPVDQRLLADGLIDNEIVCIVAPDDPLAGVGPLAARQLADRRWLLREPGSGTRDLGERFLANRELAPETLTLGSNGAIKQAVRAGLGIALISRATVEWELESGRLAEIPLSDGPASRRWYLLRSAVGPRRELVEAFATFTRSQLAPAAVS
jgi:DNA-binding transcriptional LysR family regulator